MLRREVQGELSAPSARVTAAGTGTRVPGSGGSRLGVSGKGGPAEGTWRGGSKAGRCVRSSRPAREPVRLERDDKVWGWARGGVCRRGPEENLRSGPPSGS